MVERGQDSASRVGCQAGACDALQGQICANLTQLRIAQPVKGRASRAAPSTNLIQLTILAPQRTAVADEVIDIAHTALVEAQDRVVDESTNSS